MTRHLPLTAVLIALPLLTHCGSPSMEERLKKVEAKQDSILKILATMKDQSEFVAFRVGWRPPADTAPKEIPIGQSFFQGPERAVLTVVEFTDLECPYCSQVAVTLDSLARSYPKEIKVVFKHFPLSFHPQARPAAAAAIAAGKQGKFFEFRYRLAPHFRQLKDSLYLAVAKDVGLDLKRFKQDMAMSAETARIIDADMELGRKVGVEGTPTIFVNGRLATDRSFEFFVRELGKAKG